MEDEESFPVAVLVGTGGCRTNNVIHDVLSTTDVDLMRHIEKELNKMTRRNCHIEKTQWSMQRKCNVGLIKMPIKAGF